MVLPTFFGNREAVLTRVRRIIGFAGISALAAITLILASSARLSGKKKAKKEPSWVQACRLSEEESRATGIYPVGGDVKAPIPVYKPEPHYSEEAREARIQGAVALCVVVNEKGNVSKAKVVGSIDPRLETSALETIRTWKFKPAMLHGKAVPVQLSVEVTFTVGF